MMDCENIKRFIPEYISGELDKEQVDMIEKHIVSCRFCSEEIEKEKAILKTISKSICSLPDDINEDIIADIHKNIRKPFFKNIRYISVAASLIALVVLSVYFTNFRNEFGTEAGTSPGVRYTVSENSYGLVDDELDDLIAFGPDMDDNLEWDSEENDLFESDSEILNDLVTLEEMESYDSYLSSL